ncbi:hypothetical protein [Gluconobacter japonicus]|uniref:Uncharacterized protein n=1 Tax=Gluconobacter japonicus TaxID=376620 RepID=A0ABQ5WHI6_GLUJA|nr:hypothetical protein [Gluconobacter japonicus]KXV25367.1 hypothetical protein AD938_12225 [Gluconobacter japonicus]GBR23921.1 hypothetical protein AA3271_1651 [Gluconobacter japonicus NBRC 3271]GLQ58996.1 hypothetical protein GCM10010937_07990 [Gluconobacter japonicus]
MAEFEPVKTIPEFRKLNDADILEGYLDGFHGTTEPGSDKSPSYCHGWLNGQVDAGFRDQSEAQKELAQAFQNL